MSNSSEIDINSLVGKARKSLKEQRVFFKDGDMQIHSPNIGDPLESQKAQGFGDLFLGYIGEVNASQHKADQKVEDLAAGKGTIEDVTMAMNEAEISFELMVKMSKKLEEAYEKLRTM